MSLDEHNVVINESEMKGDFGCFCTGSGPLTNLLQ